MPVERIAKVEEKVENVSGRIKNHENRLEKLEGSNETLIRIATLMEVQMDINKKTTEQMEKFGIVLERVDSNLSQLNSKYDLMEASVETMGNEVKSIKKSQAEAQEKTKIDTGQLVKNIIVGLIMLVVTVAGAWLLRATGLK